MNPWKTYRVRFCVRDYYWADVKARSEEEAERRARALYEREGEDAVVFDVSDGGADDWDVEVLEEVRA
jgi:hypothetical protein